MSSKITDEQHTDSSFSIRTASNALRRKFDINWIQLNPKSNDLACSSCVSQPIPIEANRSTPTEAELCLLICSLFPIDFRLPIEDLVAYGMALKLFGDVHDTIEGRCRLYGLIKIINHQLPPRYLNKLCVWEDKYGSQYVEVLYCAKILAKSIASRYQLVLDSNEFVKGKCANASRYEYFYGLTIVVERIGSQLALLQLKHREDSQSTLVDILESLNFLCNLRTLRLNILKLEDMSWIGCLMNLELLSISTPSLTDIPKEMGQLCNLRLLDLRRMIIAYIPSGVLSRMLKLEELYFPLSFQRWGCRAKELDDYDEGDSWEEDHYDDDQKISASNNQVKRINASISELTSLSLHALEISVPNASVLPKNSSLFKNIRRFKVFVPNNLRYKPPGNFYCTNVLQLTGDAYDIKVSGICNLMSRTVELSLMKVRNLKNITPQLQDHGFPKLQKVIISECDELEHCFDMATKRTLPEDDCLFSNLETLHLSMLPNLKAIWHGRSARLQWFENLSQISIRFCHKLKYVFPLSILGGSIHLKSIQILDCIEMDGIFYQDKDGGKDLVHYSIEELHLHSLPKLVGVWLQDATDRSQTTWFYKKMASFTMKKAQKYVAFISSKLAEKWMPNLKRLEIAFCDTLQIIFLFEKHHVNGRAFDSLMELKLFGLQNLEHVWFQVPRKMIAFQNLQLLVLSECHNKYLFSSRVAKLLVQLQKIHINRCEKMDEVMQENEVGIHKILFPCLQILEFEQIPNLKAFYSGIHEIELPLLKSLKINQCNKVEYFSYKSPRTPILEMIEINGRLCAFTGDLNTTIMRYTGNCIGKQADDDNPRSKINSYSTNERYSSDELHCTPKEVKGSSELPFSMSVDSYYELLTKPPSNDEIDGYDELYWLNERELPNTTTTVDISVSEGIEEANQSYMKEFTFADLQIATNNFGSDALLGKGGFGNVYKGWLDEGTFSPSKTRTGMAVAIKKMIPNHSQGFREWQSEVYFLKRIWHPNLIKLLGYCREDKELLLVYEFMQRGSLRNHLFRRKLGIELSWKSRLKIAIGAAQGLALLHALKNNVIYRDFKPSNILLDGNYNAKISDFGLAIFGPSGGSSLGEVIGTLGYVAPEYVVEGHVSVKDDVYSFGVVLLELMTSLKSFDPDLWTHHQYLVHSPKLILSNKIKLKNFMATMIEGQYSSKAMMLAAQLCSKCIESVPESRPSMKDVVEALQQIVAIEETAEGSTSSPSSNSTRSHYSQH